MTPFTGATARVGTRLPRGMQRLPCRRFHPAVTLARMPPLPYLQLHGVVFLCAATAFLGHVISLSAPAVVVWRTALAAIGAAAVVLASRRGTLLPPRRTVLALVGIEAIAGIH